MEAVKTARVVLAGWQRRQFKAVERVREATREADRIDRRTAEAERALALLERSGGLPVAEAA
ncbi:hypothetical protein Air01nite_63190 [Asanoa iriomotensis]|uniref:Uncharacterized protein n=2 Tax=Asanoa iriomotensis TaxID=234613 RepID=A0ABQ4CBS6_9ACTN|nr:hypothetical protein Air01nite_63190 [Asanoa iriomotensis]